MHFLLFSVALSVFSSFCSYCIVCSLHCFDCVCSSCICAFFVLFYIVVSLLLFLLFPLSSFSKEKRGIFRFALIHKSVFVHCALLFIFSSVHSVFILYNFFIASQGNLHLVSEHSLFFSCFASIFSVAFLFKKKKGIAFYFLKSIFISFPITIFVVSQDYLLHFNSVLHYC